MGRRGWHTSRMDGIAPEHRCLTLVVAAFNEEDALPQLQPRIRAALDMAEAAYRLTEPETNAQERVMMVGQAVRREVAALGEGIERTLSRAVDQRF